MELKSLLSYKSAFALTKSIVIALIVVFGVCMVVGFYIMQKEITKARENVIVIDKSGTIYDSELRKEKGMRIYEYENHVRTFYILWYSFDENSYKDNVERGLKLVGECGKELQNTYIDQEIERKLSEKSLVFEVTIKDIKIDMSTIPISGYIVGEQRIKRKKGELCRHLDCSFIIYDVDRSRENPHGCKIEKWSEVNKEIIRNNE